MAYHLDCMASFRLMKGVIGTISEFDLAQRKLRSVLDETAEGMRIISNSAIQIGKSSIFGAKGVSELQIQLAKMGFTKNDIIAMQGAIGKPRNSYARRPCKLSRSCCQYP